MEIMDNTDSRTAQKMLLLRNIMKIHDITKNCIENIANR